MVPSVLKSKQPDWEKELVVETTFGVPGERSGRFSGGSGVFHHLQAGAVLFASFVHRNHRAAERGQPAQLFLDFLQPFMAPSVGDLVHGAGGLLQPILAVEFLDLSDLRPQRDNLVLENPQMIHIVRIYRSRRCARK